MTLLAAVEDPFVREMRADLERKYRVEVTQEAGDRYEYRLRMRVVTPKLPAGAKIGANTDLRLEVRLTDYRATMEGHKVSANMIGGGEMTVDPTGLPNGVNVTGPQGPVWLPVLSFYFPGGDEGPSDIFRVPVGGRLEMGGKGAFSRVKGAARMELETSLAASGHTFGKLTISTKLDREGWPERATGTFVSADGTYHFKLERG